MQGRVDHDGLAFLELDLHLYTRGIRDVRGRCMDVIRATGLLCCAKQARLRSVTRSGRVATALAALAAHLRRRPIEFAVKTVAVRSRGGRVATPGSKRVIKVEKVEHE